MQQQAGMSGTAQHAVVFNVAAAHTCASSWPAAPPNDTITSPPRRRSERTYGQGGGHMH